MGSQQSSSLCEWFAWSCAAAKTSREILWIDAHRLCTRTAFHVLQSITGAVEERRIDSRAVVYDACVRISAGI